MSKLCALLLVAAAACGRSNSCPAIIDHVAGVMKMDLTADQRAKAIGKCEKAPAAARECIRDADTPAALAACDHKE